LAAVLHINESNAAGNSTTLYTPVLLTPIVFVILQTHGCAFALMTHQHDKSHWEDPQIKSLWLRTLSRYYQELMTFFIWN